MQNTGEIATEEAGISIARTGKIRQPLNLIFYDYRDSPEDKHAWSGTAAHIIDGLRKAGQHVTSIGPVLPALRRAIIAPIWHGYRRLRRLHYIADRHVLVGHVFSAVGNRLIRKHPEADAILTVQTTCAAFLDTPKPVFLILDATWGQIVEQYPYFYASRQPALTLRGGFELDRRTFEKSNLYLLATSRWVADRAVAEYGMDPDRTHILPWGANFVEDPERDLVLNAIDQRSGEHCNLLFVGKDFERKGGPLAVEIAAGLRARGIPATLHIVGCQPKDLPEFVNVHGFLSKVDAKDARTLETLYATSDFFVMPTRAEAQAIVFNEAAAFGLPVAATDVGGVSTTVRAGDWGLLPALDAPAADYVDWIADLFRDRVRYRETARRARDDYEARLSNRSYTRGLITIIEGVLAKNAAQ